jgi:hypothetical protein
MLCACQEKGGLTLRRVEPLSKTAKDLAWLVLQLKEADSFLRHVSMADALTLLLDKHTYILTIDSVGAVVLSSINEGYSAEVHVTFWDGRVRGRERMCRKIAEWLFRMYSLAEMHCLIPEGNTTGLRLAKAVGFKDFRHENGNVLMILERRSFTVKQLPGVM